MLFSNADIIKSTSELPLASAEGNGVMSVCHRSAVTEQYPMSQAHDTGVEPVLTGVRFVCPSSSSSVPHRLVFMLVQPGMRRVSGDATVLGLTGICQLYKLTAMEALGQYMRRRRDELDLSLREFAKRLDCSAAFISDIELGRR
jgi:hypothetical protein